MASGVLHEEFHSRDFTRQGGTLEMVQLWVNLPAKDKNAPPAYQTLLKSEILEVPLPGAAGSLRVIAGDYDGHKGPARTVTPIDVWDLRLRRDDAVELPLPEGHTALLVVLRGTVMVNGQDTAREGEFVLLAREGGGVPVEADGEATVLVLSGKPIDEPVAMYGPFVMNTAEEIRQAVVDFQSGRFGALTGAALPG